MALIIDLYQVSNIDLSESDSDISIENQERITETINEEDSPLLCVKATFRENNLWSKNIPICDGIASFLTDKNEAKCFHFNLTTVLEPDDKLRLEFYMVKQKKDQKTLLATLELMLDSLTNTKSVDLLEKNLLDSNNRSIQTTVQLKLCYTSPNIRKDEEAEIDNRKSTSDNEEKHDVHKHKQIYSKNDKKLKKLNKKFIGYTNDTDTDSHNDSEVDEKDNIRLTKPLSMENKLKVHYGDLELLEKSLGRFEGDMYQMREWQIMVHIIQARDLPGLDVNPYICVQIDEETRFTNVQKCTNSPYFEEFFKFDFKLPATQIMDKIIYIKVHDEKRLISAFTHTKPIAIFKVDIATVFNEREHEFERKWAELIHPDSIEHTCGHLLLSIAVTERGFPTKDIHGELSEEEKEEEEEVTPKKAFIPSGMPKKLFPIQLKVTFYGAAELSDRMTDFLANVSRKIFHSNDRQSINSYVELQYNILKAATSHKNGSQPTWREAFFLREQFPPLVRTLKIALKDHITVQQDRTIGSILINLLTISETNPACGFLPTLGPTWLFLYGNPKEHTNSKDQDDLSEGWNEGICYKGRLLMEIECHPITGEHTIVKNVQKEKDIQLPDPSKFPEKKLFFLFGCIFDVTMIDEQFGNTTICFELSIGSKGYLSSEDLLKRKPESSITKSFLSLPINNNTQHFRLPVALQKPTVFTNYEFFDYTHRMVLSNRLKRASAHMAKLIRKFEAAVNLKASEEDLRVVYQQMEQYIHNLPCGCDENKTNESFGLSDTSHPSLTEFLNSSKDSARLNILDENRAKRILFYIESLKNWISTDIEFVEEKRDEMIKKLHKIERALKQLAVDVQPSLPDVFLWMISDTKRVAYARIPPEDLLFAVCDGEKGLQNGIVQTIFLRTPHTSDRELKSIVNAKVQIFLWLGTEERKSYIFKQLPERFEMPAVPFSIDHNYINYTGGSHFEIRCYCCKARSLISSDDTGFSNPFLSITVGNETQTTPILLRSFCPQWNITLVFQNLLHLGKRETAEEIIGNIVVECFNYDKSTNGSNLIGRFSTAAGFKEKEIRENYTPDSTSLRWFEFQHGEKRAGELLASFELIEIKSDKSNNEEIDTGCKLKEIPVTTENYPEKDFVIKTMKNKIYAIPEEILPPLKLYEFEILFWGLRECCKIGIQAVEQVEVSIECAGSRLTKVIKDVQKNPNFNNSDTCKFLVWLPEDNNFWPHLSLSCKRKTVFGREEIVGNLVVTDLKKYLEKLSDYINFDEEQNEEDNENKIEETDIPATKPLTYDFNRVRQSVFDAYQAAGMNKDGVYNKKEITSLKKRLEAKISETIQEEEFVNDDDDDESNQESDEHEDGNNEALEEQVLENVTEDDRTNEPNIDTPRVLTAEEKESIFKMEKTANWWNKYYASKAKYILERKPKVEIDHRSLNSCKLYSDYFEDKIDVVLGSYQKIWERTKKSLGNARQTQQHLAQRLEQINETEKTKSAVDATLELIETDRLKKLSLLQSFEFFDKELENIKEFEGFNDCVDKFSLYKGKDASCSDDIVDESHVFAKLKGKIRIRELTAENTSPSIFAKLQNMPRMAINPAAFTVILDNSTISKRISHNRINDQLFSLDFNRVHITLKCRLYIIKALLFRAWDRSGKADPYIKILINDTVIIDDVKSKVLNTLEPVFGTFYEFEITIPCQSLLRIQIWDWDLTSVDDYIGETSIDVENRWLSCHRATCGLPKRYDSAGYNAWRDTKKPDRILRELCKSSGLNEPVYTADRTTLVIDGKRFDCDPECIEFSRNKVIDSSYRKAHHESPEDYIRQNTALAALHGWSTKINPNGTLVPEHVECRSLINPSVPDVEHGKLEMWLDCFPISKTSLHPPIDITPLKPVTYQLRLTIWNASDVTLDDDMFGKQTLDIYVKAWILGETIDAQQTDIHYQSLNGEGNFNWRFIFDFDYLEIEHKILYQTKDSLFQIGTITKRIPPRIVIRIYNSDPLSNDNFLGECIFDLTHLPIGAESSKECKPNIVFDVHHPSINLFATKKRVTRWWPLLVPLKVGETNDNVCLGGNIEVEFELLTAEQAQKFPVGRGREPPQPLEKPKLGRQKTYKTKAIRGTKTRDLETKETALSSSYSNPLTSTPVQVPSKSNKIATNIPQQSEHGIRVSDIANIPKQMLPPIKGFEDLDLVSIDEATDPLISVIPDIKQMVYIVKQNCTNPEDDLSPDESASIMLYSMAWFQTEKSFYFLLNKTLRSEDRHSLKPWFLYLRLFVHSLLKLPSIIGTVYRGIKMDLSNDYPEGKTFVWWPFSSCTKTVKVLENDIFFGKNGTRTLFAIQCVTGKDIRKHSLYSKEDEVLLIAAREFEVISNLDAGNDLHIIQIKEIQSPFPLISCSPTIPSTSINEKMERS